STGRRCARSMPTCPRTPSAPVGATSWRGLPDGSGSTAPSTRTRRGPAGPGATWPPSSRTSAGAREPPGVQDRQPSAPVLGVRRDVVGDGGTAPAGRALGTDGGVTGRLPLGLGVDGGADDEQQ